MAVNAVAIEVERVVKKPLAAKRYSDDATN
jgi:hypothetical protein